jgi:hypothetical protein
MTDRPKFVERKITLSGSLQLDTAMNLLRNLPIDKERPLELVVRELVKVRGLDANGLYWKRLTEIAEQAWFNRKQFSKEVWHEYARQNLMADPVIIKDGSVMSKWVESPDGSSVVVSTTLLEKKFFADYITAVEAFGASLGVMFSANPNEQRMMR